MARRVLAMSACVLLLAACAAPPPDPPDRELQVGVLLLDDAPLLDVAAAFEVFGHVGRHVSPGLRVFTVASSDAQRTTQEGLLLVPTYTLEEAPPIDVLVVTSGVACDAVNDETGLLAGWIRTRADGIEILMSVGRGVVLPGEAGLLDDRVCAADEADRDELRARFPTADFRRQLAYAVDGKLVTCVGGAQRNEAAMWLVEKLYGDAVAERVREDLGLDWSPGRAPHVVVVR